MNIHEEFFVKNFIVSEKQARYLEFLDSVKNRHKITLYFEHCNDLKEEHKSQVPISRQMSEEIYRILKAKGATDICYIISHDYEIDRREMNLKKAVDEHFFDYGTFISCIPGKLVYYASEEINGCFILEK